MEKYIIIHKNVTNLWKDGKGFMKEIDIDFSFEGKYINGEKNGKGTEYLLHYIWFEGEYFDGKKNGKGKEYNFCECIEFDGDYLDDFRRKGKEYYYDEEEEIVEYEGEYKYGRKWNGKGYDKNGNII